MEAVEGRKTLGNPRNALNYMGISDPRTLLETPLGPWVNLWTTAGADDRLRIVHSLCAGATAIVHNINRITR